MSETVIRQYVTQKIPAPFQTRFMELFSLALEDSKKLWEPKKLAVVPFYPKSGELGIQEVTPELCFDLAVPPGFRRNYTATGWQIGPVPTPFKTSKWSHLVIGGYENPEGVPRSVETQWNIGGTQRVVEDLRPIKESPIHRIGCDPFDIAPAVTCYFEVNIETLGYDWLRPIGLFIGPYEYLKARAYEA